MADAQLIRAIVASEQAIFLRGLSAMVMELPRVRMVGEARDQDEILQLCQMTRPDVLVLDWRNSLAEAQAVLEHLNAHWPQLRTILLMEQISPLPPTLPAICILRDAGIDDLRTALEQSPRVIALAATTVHDGNVAGELQHRSGEVLTRELIMAGKIQADILPEEAPMIDGWDIAASLVPARETSGDFYDFLPVANHKLGLVMADVTDKGMGAALFMVLSNTLIRTYAARFPTLPAVVLSAVSERILSDTRGGMFVTAFFGILDLNTGNLLFANAGHPAGVLIRERKGRQGIDYLHPTGMALGVSEDARWRQKEVKIGAGGCLVLYTDGITEAQNAAGDFFGEERLVETILSNVEEPACVIRDKLLEAVHLFVGHGYQQDDISLAVIRRKK